MPQRKSTRLFGSKGREVVSARKAELEKEGLQLVASADLERKAQVAGMIRAACVVGGMIALEHCV